MGSEKKDSHKACAAKIPFRARGMNCEGF